ncbi:MAG: hypothetical protein JWM21_2220 [Acidobacteria bacterium]|nr:hypothetical protein [Acidobacteriota bacterium]
MRNYLTEALLILGRGDERVDHPSIVAWRARLFDVQHVHPKRKTIVVHVAPSIAKVFHQHERRSVDLNFEFCAISRSFQHRTATVIHVAAIVARAVVGRDQRVTGSKDDQ